MSDHVHTHGSEEPDSVINPAVETKWRELMDLLPPHTHCCALFFATHQDGSMCASEVFTTFGGFAGGVVECAQRMITTVMEGAMIEHPEKGPVQ